FTVPHRPRGAIGSLVLALSVGGSLRPEQIGSQVLFRTRAGVTALRYGQLRALDATRRRLGAVIRVSNGNLDLRIDDSHAHYPLRIDPLIQRGERLAPSSTSGQGIFDASV